MYIPPVLIGNYNVTRNHTVLNTGVVSLGHPYIQVILWTTAFSFAFICFLRYLCSYLNYIILNYWRDLNPNRSIWTRLMGTYRWFHGMRNESLIAKYHYHNGNTDLDFEGFYIGWQPALLIRSSIKARQLFFGPSGHRFIDAVTNDEYRNRYKSSILFSSLHMTNAPRWRNDFLRNSMKNVFSNVNLTAMWSTVMNYMPYLCNRHELNCPIHLENCQLTAMDTIQRHVFNVMGALLFGRSENAFGCGQHPHDRQGISETADTRLYDKCMLWFQHAAKMSTFFIENEADTAGCCCNRRQEMLTIDEELEDNLMQMMEDVMTKRENATENREEYRDVMQLLLCLRNNGTIEQEDMFSFTKNNTPTITLPEISKTLIILFTRAFKPLANTITFFLYEMSLNQAIQGCLYHQMLELKSRNELNYWNITNNSYLDMCLLETLRKYPPCPVIKRRCTSDKFTLPFLNGFSIDTRPVLYVSIIGIHHDPEVYRNPLTFDPTRFSLFRGNNPHYIPYGIGNETSLCIGTRLSRIILKCTMALLIADFQFYTFPDSSYEPIDFDQKDYLETCEKIKLHAVKRSPPVSEITTPSQINMRMDIFMRNTTSRGDLRLSNEGLANPPDECSLATPRIFKSWDEITPFPERSSPKISPLPFRPRSRAGRVDSSVPRDTDVILNEAEFRYETELERRAKLYEIEESEAATNKPTGNGTNTTIQEPDQNEDADSESTITESCTNVPIVPNVNIIHPLNQAWSSSSPNDTDY